MSGDFRYGDGHWLGGYGWQTVHTVVNKAAAAELEVFILDLADPDMGVEEACRAFMERMGRSLAERQRATKRPEYEHAISVIGDLARFTRMTGKDEGLLGRKPDVVPAAAFWKMFPRFLNRSRVAMGHTSANKVESWELVSRASREIEREARLRGASATVMSLSHIKAVQLRCEQKHPNNNRLPSDLQGYVGLFEEFGRESKRFSEHYGDAQLAADMAEDYRGLMTDTAVKPSVAICFNQLAEHDPRMTEIVRVKLDLTDTDENARAYMKSTGIARHTMDKIYHEALALLRRCLERSAAFQYRSV